MEIISELLQLTGENASYRCSLMTMPELEPYWHSHPEIELSLVCHGSGLRFVGDHVGKFSSGDLLLTCDNLPHDRVTEQHKHQSEDAKVVVLHLYPNYFKMLDFSVRKKAFRQAKMT